MNIWILTIGSSDVQLKNKSGIQIRWKNLFNAARNQLQSDRGFYLPKEPINDRFLVHARVLGAVYSQQQAEQHFDDLVFPLIDNFLNKIKDQPIKKIILFLGDQSIFQPTERSSQNHAYWQDTCTLKPLLEKYLKQNLEENSPDLQFQPLFLRPTSTAEGLDDWNAVLKLVQNEFSSLKFPDDATIYVSHQAGTPAISSAVQFCSLSQFGDRVKFLVSNEQDATLTDIVKSSTYLRGIEIQQAKKLLARYDYSGMKELLQQQIEEANESKDEPKLEDEILKRISYLLDVAIQWNFAKFKDFATALVNYPEKNLVKLSQAYLKNVELAQSYLDNSELAKAYLEDPDRYWWWEAYEAAYLGVVRLKQDNTVEAMFHSFRSVEGLLYKWAVQFHSEKLEDRSSGGKDIVISRNEDGSPKKTYNAYGKGLYLFLNFCETNISKKKYEDIWTFGNFVFDRRNEIFHQLAGLQDKDAVFEEWKTTNEQGWKDRVNNCLNFLSGQKFGTIEEASLMVKVHQELERAIADL